LLGALQKSAGAAKNRLVDSVLMPANFLGESLAEFLSSTLRSEGAREASPSGRGSQGRPAASTPGPGTGADLRHGRAGSRETALAAVGWSIAGEVRLIAEVGLKLNLIFLARLGFERIDRGRSPLYHQMSKFLV